MRAIGIGLLICVAYAALGAQSTTDSVAIDVAVAEHIRKTQIGDSVVRLYPQVLRGKEVPGFRNEVRIAAIQAALGGKDLALICRASLSPCSGPAQLGLTIGQAQIVGDTAVVAVALARENRRRVIRYELVRSGERWIVTKAEVQSYS